MIIMEELSCKTTICPGGSDLDVTLLKDGKKFHGELIEYQRSLETNCVTGKIVAVFHHGDKLYDQDFLKEGYGTIEMKYQSGNKQGKRVIEMVKFVSEKMGMSIDDILFEVTLEWVGIDDTGWIFSELQENQ